MVTLLKQWNLILNPQAVSAVRESLSNIISICTWFVNF